jgi:hypothetical protein
VDESEFREDAEAQSHSWLKNCARLIPNEKKVNAFDAVMRVAWDWEEENCKAIISA